MSSIETSNLTYSFLNTTANLAQLEINIKDLTTNLQNTDKLIQDIFVGLNINSDNLSNYTSQLLDISNNNI